MFCPISFPESSCSKSVGYSASIGGLLVLILLTLPCSASGASKGEGSDLEIGGPGAGEGKFAFVRDIAFDKKNILYVLDSASTDNKQRSLTGNLLIQKFDSITGKFIAQFPISNEHLGDRNQPTRLAIDQSGIIDVAVPSAGLIEQLDPNGRMMRDVVVPHISAIALQSIAGSEHLLLATAHREGSQWIPMTELKTLLPDGTFGPTLALSHSVTDSQYMKCDSQGNICILGGVNQVYKFDPQGKLIRIMGGGTSLRLTDGSELIHSVAVDSVGNVYSMTPGNPGFVTRFDPNFTTLIQRQGQFHWADAWQDCILSTDHQNHLWVAVTGNTLGDSKYHYRPCIIRLVPDFLDPSVSGVTAGSTRLLGLNLAATASLPANVSSSTTPPPADSSNTAGKQV